MIYIEINNENEITFIHYSPFDKVNGMNKSVEELEKTGFLIDNIPTPQIQFGKNTIQKYDRILGNVYYEYADRPLTVEEELKNIKSQNAQMLLSLVMGGLM